MGWGHNKALSRHEVEREVLEGLQRRAGRDGQTVPGDIVDFLARAEVFFLDANDQPVSFERVVVAWEDR